MQQCNEDLLKEAIESGVRMGCMFMCDLFRNAVEEFSTGSLENAVNQLVQQLLSKYKGEKNV